MADGAETEVLPYPLTACDIVECGAPNPPRSPSRRALCASFFEVIVIILQN